MKLLKLLKPYWKELELIRQSYWESVWKLEEKMNKQLKGLPKLEIFHIEGEPVGIGAFNWEDRKNFKLIHDTELN